MGTQIADPKTRNRPAANTSKEGSSVGAAARSEQNTVVSTSAATDAVSPARSIFREYLESAIVTVIMALFGITFVVQAVKVPTGSMQNTINIGDQLLVNKFIFAPGPKLPFLPQRDIRRGDIVVFKYPGNKYNPASDDDPTNIPFKTNYVKRVIGMPGDKVEIRGINVYVNGAPLPEKHIQAQNPPQYDNPRTSGDETGAPLKIINSASAEAVDSNSKYTVYNDPSRPPAGLMFTDSFTNGDSLIVPEGNYFVMGDNRENSSDGRFWGVVPRELIIGRAMFVYWSYDSSAPSTGNPLTNFFTNTRWGRTGTLVK